MAAPAKSISTSIGYQDAKGNVVANGLLRLTLSQTATVTATGGQVSTDPIFLPLDVNGKIVTTAIWFSDEVSPTGTIYYGKVYKSDLVGEVPGLNSLQYSITGAGPYDLATAVQSGPASPSYAGAVLLSPSTPQTGFINITGAATIGGALSVTGNTALSGTASVALALTASTSVITPQVIQPAATQFILKDNQGGTRFSIPSGGSAQSTLNNTSIGGGSTYNGTTPSKQIFVANGTFTIPAGVIATKVTVIGGGGAGGGASASNTGAGGGSGGIAIKWLSALTPGNTLAVTIGAGGTGVSNASGNNGSASSIASGTQTISTVTANGGIGGQASTSPGPGGGALISTGGDINGAGAPAQFVTVASGFGGAGGATMFGGAGGFVGSTSAGAGAVANTGSGGGGAGVGATNAGGAGAAGIVIFEWVT